jgi:hypothetical protein
MAPPRFPSLRRRGFSISPQLLQKYNVLLYLPGLGPFRPDIYTFSIFIFDRFFLYSVF